MTARMLHSLAPSCPHDGYDVFMPSLNGLMGRLYAPRVQTFPDDKDPLNKNEFMDPSEIRSDYFITQHPATWDAFPNIIHGAKNRIELYGCSSSQHFLALGAIYSLFVYEVEHKNPAPDSQELAFAYLNSRCALETVKASCGYPHFTAWEHDVIHALSHKVNCLSCPEEYVRSFGVSSDGSWEGRFSRCGYDVELWLSSFSAEECVDWLLLQSFELDEEDAE